MARLSLNLLTASATLILLGFLTLPPLAVHAPREHAGPSPAASPRGAFGVYVDQWHIQGWGVSVGAMPTMAAKFEGFWGRRTPIKFTDQAERLGIRRVLISWEPWKPVSSRLGV